MTFLILPFILLCDVGCENYTIYFLYGPRLSKVHSTRIDSCILPTNGETHGLVIAYCS